ncbi:MAG: DUF4136 domain-containing protein [Desulfopila sp.]|jgi:uncharacterized protein YxeA|nr:DUF4136 domain-containing protein [Desulfopila sp.]
MKNILLSFIIVVFLVGCSSVKVSHQGNIPAENQLVKATYSWLEDNVPSNDIRVNNSSIDAMVRQSVEKQLRVKGYEKTDGGEAEYLLAWFGTIDEEVKEISLSSFYKRGGYVGLLGTMPENVEGGKVKKTFARGTLILDVLDREDKNVLWRGSATNTLHEKMSRKQTSEYIDLSVAKILEELP